MPSGLQNPSSEISLCVPNTSDPQISSSLSSPVQCISSTEALSSHASVSSITTSSVSLCGLGSSYESRLVPSSYSRINGIYGPPHYNDNNYMNAFATGHSSLYPSLVS